MNESPSTACRNSVWFESFDFVKFAILSPNCCRNEDLRQTFDISAAVCKLPSELVSWNCTCSFLITFPGIRISGFSILEKCPESSQFFQFLELEILTSSIVPLDFWVFPVKLPSWNLACSFLLTFSGTNFCSIIEKNLLFSPFFPVFELCHSSPRFSGTSSWASFWKFLHMGL